MDYDKNQDVNYDIECDTDTNGGQAKGRDMVWDRDEDME